jgi:hypothetical protein
MAGVWALRESGMRGEGCVGERTLPPFVCTLLGVPLPPHADVSAEGKC